MKTAPLSWSEHQLLPGGGHGKDKQLSFPFLAKKTRPKLDLSSSTNAHHTKARQVLA